ncbi:MAG: ABC transporter ATP-binding protein [Terrisporobacter sp.]
MEKINLKGIYIKYGEGNYKVDILNNLYLTVNQGEMIAIIGRSGSGKSTLLNILGGLTKPNKGKYFLNKEEISGNKSFLNLRRNEISFIVQDYGLIKDMTVYENVYLSTKYSKNNSRNRIDKILKKLDIFDKKNKLPKLLSGGECQRVSIARALVKDSNIILADEPTGALDEYNERLIMDIFDNLSKEGKTIVIVTHNLDVASKCDKIYELKNGQTHRIYLNKI